MRKSLKLASLLGLIAFSAIADTPLRIGRETNLPIPRYVSLNSVETNMRRGPSKDYQIDWNYHLKGLPMRVIGESGHWRKVEDFTGEKGWLHYALLSGNRTVLVIAEKTSMNKEASQNSNLVAILQKNVVASLKSCVIDWCEVEIDGKDGWLSKSDIWGVDQDEIFEEGA